LNPKNLGKHPSKVVHFEVTTVGAF
jgi:hypothetical protein